MPKVRHGQTNFVAGEISPLIAARPDVGQYRNGCAILKNMRPLYQGGARTRFGSTWLVNLPQSPVKLAEFVFDRTQAYIVAFSDARADIYQEDGTLATSLTSAPWTAAMLTRLNWVQLGDTMFVVHPDLAMQVITRTGATTFTRTAYAFELTGTAPTRQPYFKIAPTTMTMTPSATTGAITLTLSAPGAWTAAHVGAIVRYKKKECVVTGFTSATVVNATVLETLAGTTADTDWDEQLYSAARGYANCVTFFGDRLWFGGAKSVPTILCGSKTGAYYNFDLGTALDNEAIQELIVGSRISELRNMLDFRHLLLYFDRSVFFVPSSPSAPVTPKTFSAVEQQPYGGSYVRPQSFDGSGIYVTETGKVVREGYWVDTDQAYRSDVNSGVAEHLISAPTEVASSYGDTARVEAYLFLVNGDGNLSVYHSVRSEKMSAWTQWTTTGTYKGICSTGRKVYAAVERVLNSVTVTALEVFDESRAPLDAAKRVTSGSPTRTFAGYSHLANMSVSVVTKGHYLGDHTVSAGGVITLDPDDPEVTEIEAGLSFEQKMRPMPVDFDLQDGPARGLKKRLVRALVTMDRSGAIAVQGRDVLLDFAGSDFSVQAPTKTGTAEIRLLGIDNDAQFNVTIPGPFNVTLLGLSREVFVGS